MKNINGEKRYSKVDLEKIRSKAEEIWLRKRQDLNTELDDWLQAEREIRAQSGIENKPSTNYTATEIRKIQERAQAVRDEKVNSLRTAFDDWIEAEEELKEELTKKIEFDELFDLWFNKVSAALRALWKTESKPSAEAINDVLSDQYIAMMTECLN